MSEMTPEEWLLNVAKAQTEHWDGNGEMPEEMAANALLAAWEADRARIEELEARLAVMVPIVRDIVKHGDCYWLWEHPLHLEAAAGDIIDAIDKEQE